jgi:hypothetical protein
MKNLWRDFRFGLRLLARNPGFTIVAVLALALGIGANTAIYSIFYATIIADFPYPHSEQLVVVWSKSAAQTEPASPPPITWTGNAKARFSSSWELSGMQSSTYPLARNQSKYMAITLPLVSWIN